MKFGPKWHFLDELVFIARVTRGRGVLRSIFSEIRALPVLTGDSVWTGYSMDVAISGTVGRRELKIWVRARL